MPHKLLLADDSVTIQRVIELTFADEDVQVIAVSDGKQAIHRAQQDPPDIILADVGMPERDGYEVTTFIKQTPELKHIPVLLLTGAFEPIDEVRARAVGCDGVLVKPFEPQLVINRVRELIRRPSPSATAPLPASPSAPPSSMPPPTGSIEEYFDRLDAAFSTLDTSAVLGPTLGRSEPLPAHAANVSSGDDALAGWKPDIPSDSSSMVTLPPIDLGWPPSPSPSASQGQPPSPSASATEGVSAIAFKAPAVPPPAPPSLAEAFAALLAAEQGRPFSPAAQPQVQVDDRTIEEVTRRVLDRMSDRVVKDTVVDTAERLVREEIDRIKSNAR